MEKITSLSGIVNALQNAKTKTRIVLVSAHHKPALLATQRAVSDGFIIPILIGKKELIHQIANEIKFDVSDIEIIDAQNDEEAIFTAIKLIQNSKADAIMKGIISSDVFLSPLLKNLLPEGNLMHHVAIVEVPQKERLIIICDGGVVENPTILQKATMIKNSVVIAHKLGIEKPGVALVCATERVRPKQISTVHAQELVEMYKAGKFPNCIVEGPMAIDCVDFLKNCETKKLLTQIGGNVDVEIYGIIDAANIRYKTLVGFANATPAGILLGLQVPVILTSRSDGDNADYYSLIAAALIA